MKTTSKLRIGLGKKEFSGGVLTLQYFRGCSAPDGSCTEHSESLGSIIVPNSKTVHEIAERDGAQENL